MTKFTRAHFLGEVGRETPVFVRFSTVGGERGSADTERDPRGFAVKFYTEEGNYDMVGNNTPVFFIRDPLKFPEFIHTQKRCPRSNCKDPNMAWDFWTKHVEAMHQVMILFSSRGTPDGYRHMNGYSSHTFKWVNVDGDAYYIKYHFKTDQGIKNFTAEEAHKMKADNPDYATKDLFDSIEKGEFPSWTLKVQIMPEADADTYKYDVFDITKIWPHSDYPLIEVGKLVLDRNPTNYHVEVEQSAFSPSHLVPGIEPSNDKMLQGRLFSYPDTHRHRLGPNYHNLAINCPFKARVSNYVIGGIHAEVKEKDQEIYEGSFNKHPAKDTKAAIKKIKLEGEAGRYEYEHPNDDFEQPGNLFRNVFDEEEQQAVAENLADSIRGCNCEIVSKSIEVLSKVDENLGKKIKMLLKARDCCMK